MTLDEWCQCWGVYPNTEPYFQLMAIHANPPSVMTPDNMGDTEGAVQAKIRIRAPELGIALWRNNNGAMIDKTGRSVRFGLGNDSAKLNRRWKSSDLIGIHSTGRFLACEVKEPGWRAPRNDRDHAQAQFHTSVRALGGIAGFVTSVADFERLVLNET